MRELSGGRYNKEVEVVYVLPYLSDEDIVSGDADDNEMLAALSGVDAGGAAHGGAGDASDASAAAAGRAAAPSRSSPRQPAERSSGRLAAKRAGN